MGITGAAPPGKSLAGRVPALRHAAFSPPGGSGLYSDATAMPQFCVRLEHLTRAGAVRGRTGKDGRTCVQLSLLCTTQAPSFCPSQSKSISCAGPFPLQGAAPGAQ